MAVYTSYVGNWRGDFEKTVSYPNGAQATVNLLARIDRKGSGTLVTATYSCRIGTSSGGSQYGTVSGSLSKGGWTSSGQVRQFSSKAITITRTHATQTLYYYGSFQYKSSSETSNWYKTGALAVSIAPKSSYSVAFNANGGTSAPSTQTKWYNETLTITTGTPTRNGYTFTGWNTKDDGTGTPYSGGDSYTTNAALTLYAQWTVNDYTVAYNANGGTGTMSNDTFTYDVDETLSENEFVNDDYVFAGWAIEPNGNVVYSDGATVRNLIGSGTYNLYAIWKYAYIAPDIPTVDAYRVDEHGLNDDAGEYGLVTAHVTPAYLYSSLTSGAYTATQVTAWYRLNGSSENYTQIGSIQQITQPSALTWITSHNVFTVSNQYDIRVVAQAIKGSSVKTESANSSFISIAEFIVDFDQDGESIGIFTIANGGESTGDENKLLWMNGDVVFMLDDDAASGTDYELLAALTSLGWNVNPDV